MSGVTDAPGGFTLVEVLAALMILGLVGVAALGSVAADVRSSREVAAALERAAVADEIMARLRLGPVEEADAGSSGPEGVERVGDRTFRWRVGVTPAPERGGLLDIEVVVADPRGSTVRRTRWFTATSRGRLR